MNKMRPLMYIYKNWIKWNIATIIILIALILFSGLGAFSAIVSYQKTSSNKNMTTFLTTLSSKTITTAVLMGTDEDDNDRLMYGYKVSGKVYENVVPRVEVKDMPTVVEVMYMNKNPEVCVLYDSYTKTIKVIGITILFILILIVFIIVIPIQHFKIFELGDIQECPATINEIELADDEGLVETFILRFLKPIYLNVDIVDNIGEVITLTTDKHFISRLTGTINVSEGDEITVFYDEETNRCIAIL